MELKPRSVVLPFVRPWPGRGGLDSFWTLQEPRAQRTEPRFPTQEGCRRAPLQTLGWGRCR